MPYTEPKRATEGLCAGVGALPEALPRNMRPLLLPAGLLLLLVAASACKLPPKAVEIDAVAITAKLREGMPESEVRRIIGKPPENVVTVHPGRIISYTDEKTGHGVDFFFEYDKLMWVELSTEGENGKYIKKRLPLPYDASPHQGGGQGLTSVPAGIAP